MRMTHMAVEDFQFYLLPFVSLCFSNADIIHRLISGVSAHLLQTSFFVSYIPCVLRNLTQIKRL